MGLSGERVERSPVAPSFLGTEFARSQKRRQDAGATGGLRERVTQDTANRVKPITSCGHGAQRAAPLQEQRKAMVGLVVGDGGFEPVGGREGDGPEAGGGAVEGDGDFEAMVAQRFDADDATGFGVAGIGIAESDDVAGSHRRDGELNGAAVSIDDSGFALDDPFALEKTEARDDADVEKDALTSAAIGDGGVGEVRGVVFHR